MVLAEILTMFYFSEENALFKHVLLALHLLDTASSFAPFAPFAAGDV
jgi:hypothetical protein